MKRVCITFDIDWAPEEVIQYSVNILNEYSAAATFFATHDSVTLQNLDNKKFEIGIHPNFNPLLSGVSLPHLDFRKVVKDLLAIYPEAKGCRSHSLTQNGQIINCLVEEGLLYDSNIFLPYQKVTPYRHCNNLYRIPFNWEDDVHFLYKRSFDDIGLLPVTDDLYIYNFHPVHVFLNTDSEETSTRARPFYHQPKKMIHCRNQSKPGAENALRQILSQLELGETYKMEDVADK
jgi:hypothetical protein